VTAKSLATGLSRSAITGGDGNYVISNLPAGHYSVAASISGFKTTNIPDIELQVAQQATVNPVLEVGQTTQDVTVTAAPELLNSVSSSVGQVVDTQMVESMPLNGRSFWQLTQLTPGAAYIPGGQNVRAGGTSIRASIVNVNVNGMAPAWTGWALDGANITEFQLGGTIIQPNVDALQEFKVESANMDAQYGHTPSMINATLKSGSNEFHGVLYEFLRNSTLDARNFFYLPPPGSSLSKDPLRRNQPGATFGGPIRKDKSFFFIDFESLQLSQGVDANNVVASGIERTGFQRHSAQDD
jgi:Carboxypeptidase regulatory-like domain